MKKLLITLLITMFFCNNAFAQEKQQTPLERKIEKVYKIIESRNFTDKQAKIMMGMSLENYQECKMSARGNGYTCIFPDKLCLISIDRAPPQMILSMRCIAESEFDDFLS